LGELSSVRVPAVTVRFAVTVQLDAPVLVEQAAADALATKPGAASAKPAVTTAIAIIETAEWRSESVVELPLKIPPWNRTSQASLPTLAR